MKDRCLKAGLQKVTFTLKARDKTCSIEVAINF